MAPARAPRREFPVRALQVFLSSGELDLDPAHDRASDLGIVVMLPGGRSVALWRGAANVALHGDTAAAALYEGMAIAGSSASKWKPLVSGTGVILAPKANPVTRPSPAVPRRGRTRPVLRLAPFAIVRGDERVPLGAAWSAALGGASYRVEVTPADGTAGPLLIATTENPSFKTEPLGPGSYFMRVRAISAEGIAGQPSSPKPLRIAKLTLPPLATAAAHGAVVIAGSQSVMLDDPRDIEVATASEYDPTAAPRWVPATAELALGSSSRRVLRIRHIPSQVETELTLVRRQLRAHISFTPTPARWPDSPIDVVVKVEDPSGYIDPAHEPLSIDARVDLDKLALDWKHAGDTWTARIPVRSPPGPWVVRVNVQDKAGVAIGGSLIDVDGPRLQRAAYQGDSANLQVAR